MHEKFVKLRRIFDLNEMSNIRCVWFWNLCIILFIICLLLRKTLTTSYIGSLYSFFFNHQISEAFGLNQIRISIRTHAIFIQIDFFINTKANVSGRQCPNINVIDLTRVRLNLCEDINYICKEFSYFGIRSKWWET